MELKYVSQDRINPELRSWSPPHLSGALLSILHLLSDVLDVLLLLGALLVLQAECFVLEEILVLLFKNLLRNRNPSEEL